MQRLRPFLFLLIFPFLLLFQPLFSTDYCGDYMRDIMIARYWDEKINEKMPVFYNHSLLGGYINMPSARMGVEGTISFGANSVPPYRNYHAAMQVLERLEFGISYHIFRGIPDPIFGYLGFGEKSDKGANIKCAILLPEDSDYTLPGVAFGFEDFHGTKSFQAKYLVATQVFLEKGLEFSLGYGGDRMEGFFGGVHWLPFKGSCYPLIEPIVLTAEVDSIDYKDPAKEKHQLGRVKKSPINFGLKYRLWNKVDLSLSHIRGEETAFSASLSYDYANFDGFVTKFKDPLPYTPSKEFKKIELVRSEECLMENLCTVFGEQGFEVVGGWLDSDCLSGCRRLTVKMINNKWLKECEVKRRTTALLRHLAPSDVDCIVVVVEEEGLPVHQYCYSTEHLERYSNCEMNHYEFDLLTPIGEVTPIDYDSSCELFYQRKNLFNYYIEPDSKAMFGSARGKFKYALGIAAGVDGYLLNDLYYSANIGYWLLSKLKHLGDMDMLNPSQIINVRTDSVRYLQNDGVFVESLYLQKNWNLGSGFYSRFSGGYFEIAYGGIATQFIFAPIDCDWGVGFEVAALRKRSYTGLGFTDRVRKLEGFQPSYQSFKPHQAFIDLCYRWRGASLDFKLSVGQFLAGDRGVQLKIFREYRSGLRIYGWYSVTDAKDFINGDRYYDKGLGFSIPLDVFFAKSSRKRVGDSMSAWLRDIAVRSCTGKDLFEMVQESRR